jgi:ATP/maltotriose-dependent transcriptional regulator MalT
LIPDSEQTALLLEKCAGRFFTWPDLPRLSDWATELPQSIREKHLRLCMAVAWANLALSKINGVEPWLKIIEDRLNITAGTALRDPGLDPNRALSCSKFSLSACNPRMNRVPLSRSSL